MSDKIDHTGFQLDKATLLKDCPFVLKGVVGAVIDYVNNADINHDGKSDVAELAPFVIKAIPIITALAPLIDTDKLKAWFVSHDWVKDKAAVESVLKTAEALAEEAQKVVGK